MPELPDVEIFRRRLEDGALHRRVETVDLRDADRLKGASGKDLETALVGHTLDAARRHGKVAFAVVRDGPTPAFHFGMTGFFAVYRDAEAEPGHPRLVIGLAGGTRVAFDNQRRFGWLEIAGSPEAYVAEAGLGPDALAVDAATFGERIGGAGMVKPALMDQERIAGIGNVYSDEILFHAGIHPRTRARDVGEDRLGRLHRHTGHVLKAAIDAGADPERMPEGWLTPRRGGEAPCPRCGGPLSREKVAGRTAVFCPHCQS